MEFDDRVVSRYVAVRHVWMREGRVLTGNEDRVKGSPRCIDLILRMYKISIVEPQGSSLLQQSTEGGRILVGTFIVDIPGQRQIKAISNVLGLVFA